MNKIHHLSQTVIAKIAAGEVIERPMYAVKELIENSIDSGAGSIQVQIEDSGFRRITVIDNGEGMSAGDIVESFKPHTTSKLITIDELSQVRTLGFRGEALASIAAISKMTIKSKTKNEVVGSSVFVREGKLEKISPVGMPVGTHITVENLFHSVPTRLTFLKSQRTEFRHILDTVMHFALAYPHIQFVLTHNNKTVLDLLKTTELNQRIHKLLGNDIYESLLPVTFTDSYITVSGFIAKPQITTRSTHKQYLFINGRKVTDKGISSSVKSSFATLIEKTAHPIYLLFLSMPYEIVDVNVHPRKEEVRFVDTILAYNSVRTAVVKTLAENDLMFQKSDLVKSTDSYAGKLLKKQQLPWQLTQTIKTDPSQIIQVHNLYLLAGMTDGMVVIDQHAAHECILYEQFLDEFMKQKKKDAILSLAKPHVFELGLSESELLQEHLDTFAKMGFEIEHFKGNTFLLTSLPKLFHDRDYKKFIQELLDDLEQDHIKQLDSISRKMIAYLACRGAVKAGDVLTKKQCSNLVEKLEKTSNNATCPHGRPTKVAIGMEQMNKMFKR